MLSKPQIASYKLYLWHQQQTNLRSKVDGRFVRTKMSRVKGID
jgi:hypothetical protein